MVFLIYRLIVEENIFSMFLASTLYFKGLLLRNLNFFVEVIIFSMKIEIKLKKFGKNYFSNLEDSSHFFGISVD